MPAQSKSQQALMGMAYAYKTGKLDTKGIDAELLDKVKKLADGMTEKQLKDFASTKREKLPDKVSEGFNEIYSNLINEGVSVNTRKYYTVHLKEPKGTGMWMFQIGDKVEQFSNMKYADAKKEAIKIAKERKVSEVIPLP